MNSPYPLPFSKRLTAATVVFRCLIIAAPTYSSLSEGPMPTSAQALTTVPATIAALQLEYAQLVSVYDAFLPGPQIVSVNPANITEQLVTIPEPTPEEQFAALVTAAITAVTNLKATLATITVTGDAVLTLEEMQSVVAVALESLQKVQADE